jgi:hypothetical protein
MRKYIDLRRFLKESRVTALLGTSLVALAATTDADAAVVLNLNAGQIASGASNFEFLFSANRRQNTTYSVISYTNMVSGGFAQTTFDSTVTQDFIFNYAFTVATNGVLNRNPIYAYEVDSLFTNSSITVRDGSSIISTDFYINDLSVSAGKNYTLSIAATYIGGSLNGSNSAFAQIALDHVAALAAVPEPASWLMMIGGFGMVGGAMRRRQRVAISFG